MSVEMQSQEFEITQLVNDVFREMSIDRASQLLAMFRDLVDSQDGMSEQEKTGTMQDIVKTACRIYKENATHCGVPSKVSASYDFEQHSHHILIHCPSCGNMQLFSDREV